MGIQGLLPFLKSIQRPINVSSFDGQTAAVDAYCWLHKGAYTCAQQLVMKEGDVESLPFVNYCMKRINMLRMKNVKVLVVFDGSHLPTKANVEAERRKRRLEYLKRGKDLLREGKRSEAHDCFQKCVDVTPQMALAFIKACRSVGVECIVAPYEADAQLAFLSKSGIADLIITEDSDLLVFGCKKVLFKMSDTGDGLLIDSERLGDVESGKLQGFNEDSFRQMCILSGCDYLPSVPGMGLSTANKLMKKFGKDPQKVIVHLKMQKGKSVPKNYTQDFQRAEHTFLYQLVFDPRMQKQVRLNPLPDHVNPAEFEFAGTEASPRKAVGLARGNINPITFEIMNEYSPSKPEVSSVKEPVPQKRTYPASKGSRVWTHQPGGKNGVIAGINKLPAISSSKKASKPFKPPGHVTQVSDGNNDQSMDDNELMIIYNSGRSEDTEEGVQVCTETLNQNKATVSKFFASDSCKEEDDEDTPLGSQHRLLSRLTSIAKQLKFERNTPPVNPAVPSTENSSHKTDTTSGSNGHDNRQLPVSSTPPDRQSTMDCAIRQPHCATGESTKANTSESSTSVVMDSPQHSSGPAPHRGGASVRKSLQQFQFSPPTSEVSPTTPVGTSTLKRRPSSPQPADSNPSKRFLSQEDLVSTGIGYLEKVELLKREGHALSGSEGQDGTCVLGTPETVSHGTTIDTWDSTTNNRDTTYNCVDLETFDPVDLTTEADERVTPSILSRVRERAGLTNSSRKKRPGLCRPSKAQSGGFKPPLRASSSGPTVQTKLTSILERCKYTKKEGIKKL